MTRRWKRSVGFAHLAEYQREPSFHGDDITTRVEAAFATIFPDADF